MKHLLLIPAAALALSACVPAEQTCGPVADVVIAHTKEGSPIYMHPLLLPPCVIVTPSDAQTPTETPTPASTPPTHVKPNAGRGNGPELDSNGKDRDPGNSGGRNKGGD